MSHSGNGRKSITFRRRLQYYKLEIQIPVFTGTSIEISILRPDTIGAMEDGRNNLILSRVEGACPEQRLP
jgi:hypothetical protein